MHFTKKIDRAFQWAGEKVGGQARTAHSDEFKNLETEMALRQDGMERLHKSMGGYVKWISRRSEVLEDKEKSSPVGHLGRSMAVHGEDFEQDSEFGNCLLSLGRANERIAGIQETYVDCANATWMDSLERNLAMMKEYQTARKKLESRRLAYDASTGKLGKARRDDFRIEEEVRMNKAKFEESSEDVIRRMQDIKESEVDSIASLTQFLDAELEYHERCTDELRRVRQAWAGAAAPSPTYGARPNAGRSRSNTARSWQEPRQHSVYEEPEPEPEHAPEPVRIPTRSPSSRRLAPPPPQPPRPSMARASTFEGRTASYEARSATPLASLRPVGAPLSRVATDSGAYSTRDTRENDVFSDDISTPSRSASPDYWGARSASPATSYGSMSRSTSALGKKPPPPVNRAKKPPPPPPARRENLGY
ncbi:hypothetical protein B0J13DRAFT_59217 [Dactylonectria estremocensis]|uniref:BAR domain-containing protein n=1 Tax=Dactylonectria estremocensis TaxID=1079267 RepID=A0A9P9EPX6_9HYPO|nr:hypothetical protein B0J13DRAFT_59217 [Dactylonectria estremocensis]